MKVKRAKFFYNTHLLNQICTGESKYAVMGHDFTDTIEVGDIIKLIGEEKSDLVKITYINPRDCNGSCATGMELVKLLIGELHIDYDVDSNIVVSESDREIKFSSTIQSMVDLGISVVLEGYSVSKKNLLALLEKDVLTDAEKTDFRFYSNIFMSGT